MFLPHRRYHPTTNWQESNSESRLLENQEQCKGEREERKEGRRRQVGAKKMESARKLLVTH